MTLVRRSQAVRLAMLIDAENASAKLIEPILKEAAKYGVANVRRIYGDWTTPELAGWKIVLNPHAIQPVQQFRYTARKSVADSALIIDAMDLLHSGNIDGFCVVSSDSDFTRLACRIRESGLAVYGFGEKKTPEAFVKACDQFIYVENLTQKQVDGEIPAQPEPTAFIKKVDGKMAARPKPAAVIPAAASAARPLETRHVTMIRSAYAALAPEGGWVTLAELGNQILKLSPTFDSKAHGHPKLWKLVASLSSFQIEQRTVGGKVGNKSYYVKIK